MFHLYKGVGVNPPNPQPPTPNPQPPTPNPQPPTPNPSATHSGSIPKVASTRSMQAVCLVLWHQRSTGYRLNRDIVQ